MGAANKVKPSAPLVVLRLGTVTRAAHPIQQPINGIVFSAYPSEAVLQTDLFTRGRRVKIGGGEYYENTAVNDMLDFINFLDSPSTVEWGGAKGISTALMGGVRDLTELINDSQWQYRAMAELRLAFTQWTAEYNGVLGEETIIFDEFGLPTDINFRKWKQTSSGGGTKKLAKAMTGFFEGAEIKYDYDKEALRDG